MKKLLSIILALLMVCTVVPAFAITATADYAEDTIAVIGDAEYTSLDGETGALASAEAGDRIVLVKDIKIDSDVTVDKKVIIDLAGYTIDATAKIVATDSLEIASTKDGLGVEYTDAKATINFGASFISTTADFKVTNVNAIGSVQGSFFENTSTTLVPKFTAKDSNFDLSSVGVISSLSFKKNAVEIDMQDCNVVSGYNHNKAGFLISSQSFGRFKNVKFTMNKGISVSVEKTGDEGVVFDGCNISQETYDQEAVFQMSGGKVTLTGGTVVDGLSRTLSIIRIYAGSLTLDGATLTRDKGDNAQRFLLNIQNTPTLNIVSASFVKNGGITNSPDKFKAGIAEGCAIYSSATPSVDTILSRAKDVNSSGSLYVLPCQHYCTVAQEGSNICAYCLSEAEISHDYSTIDYNETQHWDVCSRCYGTAAAEDHAVGEEGTAATCTTKPVCGVCEQEFGKELGHSFTDYQPVSIDVAGCEHNVVTKAVCDNGCGEEDYDYSTLTNIEVTKEAVDPTCTEIGKTAEKSCITCGKVIQPATDIPANGHNYGDEIIDVAPTYRAAGKAYKICKVETCKYKYEYDLPALKIAAKIVAVIGDDGAKQFGTLKAAIEGAEDGDVIVLVKDVEEELDTTVEGKDIIVDLAGHNLSYTTNSDAAITTDSDFTLRNTNGGWGVIDNGVTEVFPSAPTDTYYTVADVSNPDNWRSGHYSTDGAYQAYDGRACLKKLVEVDNTKTYKLTSGTSDTTCQLIIREYTATGRFLNSVGALANGTEYKPNSNAKYISVSIYKTNDSTADFISMINNGTVVPSVKMVATKAVITYSKPLVSSTGKMSFTAIKGIATTDATIAVSGSNDTAAPAELAVNNCDFTLSNTSANAAPISFTKGVLKVDFNTVKVQSGRNGNGVFFNSEVSGTFRDTVFTKNQGASITVSKTAAEGIVFDGCQVSQSSYDQNVSLIAGGKVTLTGGTIFNGNGVSSIVIRYTGGTLIMDDAEVCGDKGTDAGRVLLYIGADNLDIQIKKAAFKKNAGNNHNGSICNDNARFVAAIADECACFYENVSSGEFAYTPDTNFVSLSTVYVNKCNHEVTSATCDTAGECIYCLKPFDALGHDNLGWAVNEEEGTHYKVCSRCDLVDETYTPEAHKGGTPDCEKKALCEVCFAPYGDVLGHDFTDKIAYNEVEHWIACNREDCAGRKDVEPHSGGTAKCEAKAVCTTCEQEYGSALGHRFIDYISDGNAGCTTNGSETAECTNGCGLTDTRIVLNSALGHNWEKVPEIPATCSSVGWTEGSKCSRCPIYREEPEQININNNAHSWDAGKISVAGDCSHDSVYTYTCKLCEKTSNVSFGKVAGKHVYSKSYTVDVKATYFAAGSKSKHCLYCNAKTSVTKIAKLKLKAPKVTVKAGDDSLKVKYNKVKGATHFQVKYTIGKKTVTKTYKAKKTLTKTIKKLSAGKYKVQVRAMVKKGSKKAYSAWTKAKKYTVK